MVKKIGKILLFALLALVLLVLVVPAFLPKSYQVTRSAMVKGPAKAIYPYLGNFDAFNLWQPWIRMEPSAKKEVTGTPFQAGHQYKWDGQKLQKGSMTLTGALPDQSVTMDLDFGMGGNDLATTTLSLKEEGGATRVTWFITGNLGYFNRPFGLMMDKMLGPDFESGLGNLKAEVEKTTR